MKNIALLLLISIPLIMDGKPQKKFNFEMGLGYSLFSQKHDAKSVDNGLGFYFEGRINSTKIPIDVGVQLGLSTFSRTYLSKISYRSFSVLSLVNYSLMKGKKLNPYVGTGLGVSFSNTGGVFNSGFKTNLSVMPRIGVRFMNRANLSVDYQFIDKYYSHLSLQLGYYF